MKSGHRITVVSVNGKENSEL